MNQVSDRGVCLPEDMNKNEDQTKSGGSIESSDTSHVIHVSCGRPSSSGISMQSIVKLYVTSVNEEAEPFNCNVNVSPTQKKDVIAGVSEVVEEAKDIITYQKKKRLKTTHLSDHLSTNDLEITEEDTGSALLGLPQRVGSITPCCYESISEKRLTAEDRISVEKDLDCVLGFRGTSSNDDDKVLIEESNGNASEKCDADMLALALPDSRPGSAIVLEVVPNGIKNDEFPQLDSGDAYCNDVAQHLNDKMCFPVCRDATTKNRNSCDADMLANNLLDEIPDEAGKMVSNFELHNAGLEEKVICNLPRISVGIDTGNKDMGCSGAALSRDTPLHPDEESVASDADNPKQYVAVERAFAGYTWKKLLVLDVNGLLVDISSYVPYDYDPDDIIRKKAVFKRPCCDDFLKFCFDRFNVGVWTSRTKRNMEPIIDFLLGKDKCKLLFCWDQSHCTYTGFTTVEKRRKPLLLKKLKKLWNKSEPDLPWESGVYNESNTLLLDDTPSKALSNPRYNAVFPYTYRFRNVRDTSLGPGGDLRVYLEGLTMAENVQDYVKQNPFGQRPITEKNLSWGFYLKVIDATSTPPRQTKKDDS